MYYSPNHPPTQPISVCTMLCIPFPEGIKDLPSKLKTTAIWTQNPGFLTYLIHCYLESKYTRSSKIIASPDFDLNLLTSKKFHLWDSCIKWTYWTKQMQSPSCKTSASINIYLIKCWVTVNAWFVFLPQNSKQRQCIPLQPAFHSHEELQKNWMESLNYKRCAGRLWVLTWIEET
jgi:hypothetical protein